MKKYLAALAALTIGTALALPPIAQAAAEQKAATPTPAKKASTYSQGST